MYALTKAMDHMHRNGIFHRDIKPVRNNCGATL
jgi:renal tumor antigen